MEYEEENGVRTIYRTYEDTEVAELWTACECPYCEHEQDELGKSTCGETYVIECENCERKYEMYFDAS